MLSIKTLTNVPTRVRSDVRWGVTGGLSVAAFYCLWVTAVYIVNGSAPFERNGVTFFSTVTSYLILGIVGGVIVGVLRPLSERRLGAYGIGFIVGLLSALGLMILVAGWPTRWDVPEWGTIPFVAAGGGWAIGSELWKRRRGRSRVG